MSLSFSKEVDFPALASLRLHSGNDLFVGFGYRFLRVPALELPRLQMEKEPWSRERAGLKRCSKNIRVLIWLGQQEKGQSIHF